MKRLALCLLILAFPALTHARAVVVKKVLGTRGGKQILANPDLEKVENGQIVGLSPWGEGYAIDAAARSGKVAARCELKADTDPEMGMTYLVTLNQKQPLPFTCELWSKAQEVSGSANGDYSLYVDLTYMDGTPLWGNLAPFATGTHDWQKRAVTIAPAKPVKEVLFHAIFRRHTGIAWFDDFAFYLMDVPAGSALFDGIPVERAPAAKPAAASRAQGFYPLGSGVTDKIICLDGEGRWVAPSSGGLFLRDAKGKSDFRLPLGKVSKTPAGYHFEGTDEELGLKLVADYRSQGKLVRIEGHVEDLRGEDRGVSVYCALGSGADTWHDDMRTSRRVTPGETYSHVTQVGCGANGTMSLYPFGCVTRGQRVTSVGAPLDPPFLFRFAYDSGSKELYGVEDLGLSRDYGGSPSRAPFSFIVSAEWTGGFRAALDAYYRTFPDYFVKRNKTEGLWVAFDDIAGIQGFEDFGIAFKEGTNNPAFDESKGIVTYTYVEPASYWMAMGELPRTLQAAQDLLGRQLKEKQLRAVATETSGIRDADGQLVVAITDAPWCDGALYTNNPDPDIPTTDDLPVNQGQVLWRSINADLDAQAPTIADWRFWVEGYEPAPGEGRNGSQAAVCNAPEIGEGHGLSQSLIVDQAQPGKVTVSAWSKGENVTGVADNSYAVYCDVSLKSGKPSYAHVAPFSLGTHDWEKKEVVIDLPEPIMSVHIHLLFRQNHSGKAWFDDVSVKAEGSDLELAHNPGLEPGEATKAWVDGTYIDSLEMGASMLDFDRKHWGAAHVPLVYTTLEGLPTELLMWGSYEFIKDVSEKMHAQGRTIFANSVLLRFPHPAAVLDIMGVETNWNPGGRWLPMSDAECSFKRALCYQRPYLLLQNTAFEDFGVKLVEKYMKRSVFYGLAPSFFSHNAANATYWSRPDIYNRDRHLFKKYVPVYQTLSAAGWEPLTHATTGNPKVYVERYGKGDDLHFALFNDSPQVQSYTLKVDLKALGVKAKGVLDVLAGADAGARVAGDRLTLAGKLDPEDLRVLRVTR